MFERLQEHPITQGITATLKIIFYILSFASINAILYHYFTIDICYQLSIYTLQCIPACLCLLLSYELTKNYAYALIGMMILLFHYHYLDAFVVALMIYVIDQLTNHIIKNHYLKDIPQFVENSIKDVGICIIFLLLAWVPLPQTLPFSFLFDTPYFFIMIVFIHCYSFYKGYHPALMSAFVWPIEAFFLMENIQAFLNNQPLQHLFTHGTMSAFCSLSGTAITIGIVFLASRSFPKGTLLSAFFGVNEQVIFGLPVVREKDCFFPFVIGGTLNAALPIVLMYLGYLNKPIFDAPYVGLGFEGFLVNLDWRSFIVAVVQILLSIMIWYPYYRKKVKKNEI